MPFLLGSRTLVRQSLTLTWDGPFEEGSGTLVRDPFPTQLESRAEVASDEAVDSLVRDLFPTSYKA